MLRVTVELISAVTGNTSKLATAYIANDGKGTRERGNYDVKIMRKGITNWLGKATREGRVEDFPRLSYSVWRLISRCLLAAFPEESKAEPGKTRLDADVMKGLRQLADLEPTSDARGWSDASQHALAWLKAGDIEPEMKATEALGCDLPESDARENLQRSVFRGLKLLGGPRGPSVVACGYTADEQNDIEHARSFINALPEC